MSAVDDLPFLCDTCGERFGFGDSAGLLSVVREVRVKAPTPCCGTVLDATVTRHHDMTFSMEIHV